MAKHRKIAGFFWIVVFVAAAASLGFYFLRKEDLQNHEKYKTELVGRGDVTMTVVATGSISAVTTVQVGSQVSGIIARLYADFNSPVQKGQLIADLDPTPFEATVAQRRADLSQSEVQVRNNRVTFERMKKLLQESLIAQADYDNAKANLDASEAQVEQSRAALLQATTNLAYTKIRSPIDGVVVDRQYDVGQTVAASFQAPTLFTIAQDLKKMQVQADVDQSDIGRVTTGQTVRFTVDAYSGEEFQGTVTQVRLNATVNLNVITYPVIIQVPNPEEKLRPKMTADVTIEVATVRDVLRVPNAALRFRPMEASGAEKSGPERGAGTQGSTAAAGGGAPAGSERRADAAAPLAGTGAAARTEATAGVGSAALAGATEGAKGGAGAGAETGSEERTGNAQGDHARGDAWARPGRREGGLAPTSGSDGAYASGSRDGTAEGRRARGRRGLEHGRGPSPDGMGAARSDGHDRQGGMDPQGLPGLPAPQATGPGGAAGSDTGFSGAARHLESVRGGSGARRGMQKGMQTLYVLPADPVGALKPVPIRTGLSDGRFTQIIQGDLKEGDRIVVGLATSKVETSGAPFGGGGGPGGRRGMF